MRNIKEIFSAKPGALLIIIMALVILAHSPLLQNNFVLDDAEVIQRWTLIQRITNLPRFFVNYVPPDSQEGIYAPLRVLFLAVCRRVFAPNPWATISRPCSSTCSALLRFIA